MLYMIKQAGILDSISDFAPEGLGGLMGAGSAMGLSSGLGLGNKGQLISAAIGATIGAMAANKMKEHEQIQQMDINNNSELAIQNALMNLDQQNMFMGGMGGMVGGDPYADPNMMGGMPGGMGGMDPNMMGGGMPEAPQFGQPVAGYPDAMQAMQGQAKQASQASFNQASQASFNQVSTSLVKTASDLLDAYFS